MRFHWREQRIRSNNDFISDASREHIGLHKLDFVLFHQILERVVVAHGLLGVVVRLAHSSHEVATNFDVVDDLRECLVGHVALHEDSSGCGDVVFSNIFWLWELAVSEVCLRHVVVDLLFPQ